MIEEVAPEEIKSLSYSSASTQAKCEQKYVYYKVEKVSPDADADLDTYAFRVGKAFHRVQELTMHRRENYTHKILGAAIDEYELSDEDMFRVYACCMMYYEAAEQSGIEILLTELEFKTDETYGFIDAIGIDSLGRIWIVDLKTTSRYQTLLPARLARDPQLSLYAAHISQIIAALQERGYKVSEEDFGGISYRAISKPEHVVKTEDTPSSYYERVRGAKRKTNSDTRVVFINISKEMLDVAAVRDEHQKLWERSVELRHGAVPKRNYNSCIDYNRTCEYFSRCYGSTATEMMKHVNVSTLSSQVNVAELGKKEDKRRDDMLNIQVKNCNWFPADKSARIDVEVQMGANGPSISRPFYFQGEVGPDFMNECIVLAMHEAKIAFWMHLSSLRKDECYQSWAAIFKPVFAVPPVKGATVAAEPPAAKEEPKPTPALKAPAPAPVVEETEEDEEEAEEEAAPAKKPAAKPAAAKPAPETVAKKKPAKKVDEVVWTMKDKAKSAYLKAVLDENLPKDWHKKPKYAALAVEISTKAAEEGIILLRDGEVTDEFVNFVVESL